MIDDNKNQSVVWHNATVTRERRERLNQHKGIVFWFTGLSGAGKSTLAHTVEEWLHQNNCRTIVLDGDNIRQGLNGNLGFSDEDRLENNRRVAEVCKLFVEAGVIVLAAFISPFKKDRAEVKRIIGADDFVEIFCDCSIDVCEKRDGKGLYKKARAGEIINFTGISSPYEKPDADLIFNTGSDPIQECVKLIVSHLVKRNVINVKNTAN